MKKLKNLDSDVFELKVKFRHDDEEGDGLVWTTSRSSSLMQTSTRLSSLGRTSSRSSRWKRALSRSSSLGKINGLVRAVAVPGGEQINCSVGLSQAGGPRQQRQVQGQG